MPTQFIPQSYKVPKTLETNQFFFRVLEENVAELDYEAVMSSRERLKSIFGPNSHWPKSNMTLAENRADLKVHKQEFESRKAFAYSVFNSSRDKCLGSVYIDPSQSENYDCEVYLWVREDSAALDERLYQTVVQWLKDRWPFNNIAFPGRSISWENWAKEVKVV
ncbi:hypothetical protein EZV61_19350 [Corallincola luteus]|uniref:GNAT family N-acetyltransferase n=1 Tax=Corallincola luteus TaxID=1775177 RepID=A0ABY2AF99_9GAMM|nr:hypothetical protein [Corallincola luteus]TCI01061.1 hypothetical protein EZV61_19350 [Corallincola luteus]